MNAEWDMVGKLPKYCFIQRSQTEISANFLDNLLKRYDEMLSNFLVMLHVKSRVHKITTKVVIL